ncbi:uncharacterized protein LOC113294007 [Papaver somniferum]|uniref:uncharacterized protein LOC113294007 n=1 Tax=Papaver somniferum TaxID=3469 RepID=UPI000E6F942D|nr:uncharacterized protein LOC113294007 [Papaver somniferum]
MHGNFKNHLNANDQLEWDFLRDIGVVPTLVEGNDEVNFPTNYNKFCYQTLAGDVPDCSFSKFLWKNYVPSKVSFLLWAVYHKSLPKREMLRHRRVELDNIAFPLCKEVLETSDHLLLHCHYLFQLWDYFIKSMQISWTMPAKVLQLFEAWDCNVLKGKCKNIWNILHYAIIWNVGNERNRRVFGGRSKDVEEVIVLIKQSLVFWSCDMSTSKFTDSNQIIHNWELALNS